MDRHWFPAILLGFSVLLALVFAVVLSPQGQELLEQNSDVRQVTQPEVLVDESTYQATIVTLLEEYQSHQDVKATYAAVIAVRVPASMLNLHYELVIALGKLQTGDNLDAVARFSALKAQHPWLPL